MNYIYGIFKRDTEKCIYIGQSKDWKRRQREHFKDIENKRHKIKKLNTFKPEELEFKVLLKLDTTNSLIVSFAECCYNSIYKPYNKCVLQGFQGSVTLARCENDIAEDLLKVISNY
jgi:hypothetical protein